MVVALDRSGKVLVVELARPVTVVVVVPGMELVVELVLVAEVVVEVLLGWTVEVVVDSAVDEVLFV